MSLTTGNVNLEAIYEAILKTGWLIVNDQGEVLRNLSAAEGKESKNEAFILLDKVVAIPTRNNLNRSGRDNLLIFHPLMEGLVGGESPVIGKLRRAYGIRMTFAAAALFKTLLAGATHTTEYNKFSPSQMRLFKAFSDVNEKTIKQWDRIMRMSIEKHGATNAFVDAYTNRNVMHNGQPYSRVTSVRFPIYEELIRSDKMIFGKDIQLSTNDRANFRSLFEFAFEDIDIKDQYTYGTNSRIAPYLDALLGAFGKLFGIVNSLYDEFSSVIIMDESIRVELDWPEWFTDIESLKTLAQSVPQQYGNYAVKVEDEQRQSTGTSTLMTKSPVATIGFPAAHVAAPVAMSNINQQDKMTGYDQVKQIGVSVNHVVEQTQTQQKFVGIGKPLAGANGIVEVKQPNLEAVIISNSQSRVMIDPVRASLTAAMEVMKHGGVGRVSASDVRPVGMGGAIINNQPLNFGGNVNNGGWANSSLNAPTQVNNGMSAAMIMREVALNRLMSDPTPFSSSGMLSRGSTI
jgi:hypothetical protein